MKIQFIPFSKSTSFNNIQPIPAIKNLPDWWPKIPQFGDGSKKWKMFANNTTNETVKWCNPFLDSLTAGYQILLPYDLVVRVEDGQSIFVWKVGGTDFISTHSKDQVSPAMIPAGYNSQPFKFRNDYGIKTPAGYSSLFTHPANRTDLPFLTLTGLVDTDTYNNPVNFPFLIRADFEGVIPKGTPLVQIIPVKRERWEMQVLDFDEIKTEKMNVNFYQHAYRAYKNHYWHRKEYK